MTPIDYGSEKSSGSISESSGSSNGSGGNGSSGGSSGGSSSGSETASFEILDVTWIDTTLGDPSVLDCLIHNNGTVPITITAVTGTADGFTATLGAFPDQAPPPATLAPGESIACSAFTSADVPLSGTSFTVDSDIAGSKTVNLIP